MAITEKIPPQAATVLKLFIDYFIPKYSNQRVNVRQSAFQVGELGSERATAEAGSGGEAGPLVPPPLRNSQTFRCSGVCVWVRACVCGVRMCACVGACVPVCVCKCMHMCT